MDVAGLIHTGFQAQARRRPEALAVSAAGRMISYGELDALATRLALWIREDGEDGVVAILAERGPRVIVAALACLKAARPFVVLDLSYPEARLRTLAQTCRPQRVLLAARGGAGRFPDLGLPTLAVDLDVPAATGSEAAAELVAAPSPDAPAYLLFTSGSTGQPKCVACSHRPLVNFVAWQARTFALGADDRFTMLSGLSHDPILRDIFTPLSVGASIHIPSQATLTAPGGLFRWFAATEPTVAHMTPPLGHLLTAVRRPAAPLEALRYVFWGGDVLRYATVEAVSALAPGCESVNFYGSTETPQAASYHRVARGACGDRAPVGAGVDGFELAIEDDEGRAVAPGDVGEIVIRSRFLTLGYVRDGRLPGQGEAGGSYRTGDLGLIRADGQAAILGRRDDQVKVRGYRVEMAEVTAGVLKAPGVAQAVTLNLGSADRVRLCAFIEAAAGAPELDPAAVRAHLAATLPAYMVPEAIAPVARLPLLPNGKIDRQALIAAHAHQDAPATIPEDAELSPAAAALIAGWRGFLGHDIHAGSSFASSGGDSLSYVNAYLTVEQVLGAVPEGWTTMTVAELAATKAAGPVRPRLFAKVESAILLRATAIAMVVASHFQLVLSGGGATSALIWVSGFLFGSLQLRAAEHRGDLRPIAAVLKSVLIPLAVYEAPQLMVKWWTNYHFHWSSLFLYVDLLDYRGTPASGPDAYGGHEFVMWYIHCLFHIILVYVAAFAVCRYLLKLRRPAFVAVFAVAALGLFGRFVLPALVTPGYWSAPVEPMSFFNHAPTTHLATFALAVMAGFLKGRFKPAMLAVAVAYAALSAPLFGAIDAAAIAVVAGLLLYAPQLSVPRVLSRPIYLVAGASLFIYLLHLKVLAVLCGRLHLPPLAVWPLAIGGGVLAWSAWNWGAARAGRLSAWTVGRGLQGWRWAATTRAASA